MKSKTKPPQVLKGDAYIKPALIWAHDLMEHSKISDKRIWLRETEKRFDSFQEIYLAISGILCAVVAFVAVLLAIFFPPALMRVAFAKYEGFLHWLFGLLYILAVGLFSIGFVFGLFYALEAIGTSVHLSYGKKFDQELISWTQSSWHKRKSNYSFERIKPNRKYRSSYGYWDDSAFMADEKFYEDAKKNFSFILSNIPGLITQEQVNEIVADEITDAQKERDADALIIACYFSQYTSFETLKKRLFD